MDEQDSEDEDSDDKEDFLTSERKQKVLMYKSEEERVFKVYEELEKSRPEFSKQQIEKVKVMGEELDRLAYYEFFYQLDGALEKYLAILAKVPNLGAKT